MSRTSETTARTLAAVFGTLLVLTVVSVGASFVNLGPLNAGVALAIGGAKALLVALFFMELRHGPRLLAVFAAGGLLWLGILLALTLSDYLAREWVP
jgi:cytochrome c oxidase subunit 4